MKINIINRQKKVKMDTGLFSRVTKYIADKFDNSKDAELNIIFTGKEEISQLNKKYRNIMAATDVLSFSYQNTENPENNVGPYQFLSDTGPHTVGEIIISPEIAEENVKKGKENDPCWNFGKEITLLVIHGILHIYDYDHEKRRDRTKMENIQQSILTDLQSNFNI